MRPGDCRRRPGRFGRRGLCGFRRAQDRGAGKLRAGRPGGILFADRELFRLPHRHSRRGADLQRATSGLSVRREVFHARAGALADALRTGSTARACKSRAATRPCAPSASSLRRVRDYRRLEAEGRENFEGSGVYYAATAREGQLCRGSTVIVAGGGNSAGQAAMFLSEGAEKVLLVIRGEGLGKEHVELSLAPRRGEGEHRDSGAHGDPEDDGREGSRSRRAGEHEDARTAHRADAGRLFHDRRKAVHRLAAARDRAR